MLSHSRTPSLCYLANLLRFCREPRINYLTAFEAAGIDVVDHLSLATEEELVELGIKKFHAKAMLRSLAAAVGGP